MPLKVEDPLCGLIVVGARSSFWSDDAPDAQLVRAGFGLALLLLMTFTWNQQGPDSAVLMLMMLTCRVEVPPC